MGDSYPTTEFTEITRFCNIWNKQNHLGRANFSMLASLLSFDLQQWHEDFSHILFSLLIPGVVWVGSRGKHHTDRLRNVWIRSDAMIIERQYKLCFYVQISHLLLISLFLPPIYTEISLREFKELPPKGKVSHYHSTPNRAQPVSKKDTGLLQSETVKDLMVICGSRLYFQNITLLIRDTQNALKLHPGDGGGGWRERIKENKNPRDCFVLCSWQFAGEEAWSDSFHTWNILWCEESFLFLKEIKKFISH